MRALATIAVAGLLGLTLHVSAAQAHDTLVSSAPAEGETLTVAPTEVRLTFNNEILDLNAAIVLTDPDGAVLTEEPPVVDGADVALPVPDGVPAGVWTVTWRVVSSDGHPISGTYDFTVDTPAEATTTPAQPTETTEPTEAVTTDDAEPAASDAPSESASPADEDADDGGSGPGEIIAFVALALAVIGVAAALVVRRMRSGDRP
ncbi:copper resistance CopC family protein [Occultella glacieicola]|uniref:copper resistance CopC family protein n=1 Tax=Occultella glacieicola TaxID=2518684 RepID=UPI001404519A|nr:copper resistance CopC family protein [Occultella glacieicola]